MFPNLPIQQNKNSVNVILPENYSIYHPDELFKEDNLLFEERINKLDIKELTKEHLKKIINVIWLSIPEEIDLIINNYLHDNKCTFLVKIINNDLLNNKMILSLKEMDSNIEYHISIN